MCKNQRERGAECTDGEGLMAAMVPIPIFPSLPSPKLPRAPASLRSEAKSSQGPEHGLQHPQSQEHRQPLPGDQPGGGATGDGDKGQGRDAGWASQVAEGGRQGPGGGPGLGVRGGRGWLELNFLPSPLLSAQCPDAPSPVWGGGHCTLGPPLPGPRAPTVSMTTFLPPLPWPPLLILGVATPGAPPSTPCLAQSSCRPRTSSGVPGTSGGSHPPKSPPPLCLSQRRAHFPQL